MSTPKGRLLTKELLRDFLQRNGEGYSSMVGKTLQVLLKQAQSWLSALENGPSLKLEELTKQISVEDLDDFVLKARSEIESALIGLEAMRQRTPSSDFLGELQKFDDRLKTAMVKSYEKYDVASWERKPAPVDFEYLPSTSW
ncbi:hypothetical protein E6H36_08005 [Candidatus Bathyarchaeota archaeon]|nr:MAG: hypothetical protein E6H36_08005 [Candidatus Bathyarchaeota archaeon]TMI32476.1 MAG: hypothetical protein E6H29_02165 [Candidatus Bathyarchaeota archaeon]